MCIMHVMFFFLLKIYSHFLNTNANFLYNLILNFVNKFFFTSKKSRLCKIGEYSPKMGACKNQF